MIQLLVEVALRELSDNEDDVPSLYDRNPESSDDDESVSSEDSYVASGSRSGSVAPPLFRRSLRLARLARLGRRIMDDRLPAGGNESDDTNNQGLEGKICYEKHGVSTVKEDMADASSLVIRRWQDCLRGGRMFGRQARRASSIISDRKIRSANNS